MYTFWDYMRNRWPRDAGLRIDHLLVSAQAADRLVSAGVDRQIRGRQGASDHAPVWVVLRCEGAAKVSEPRAQDRARFAAAERTGADQSATIGDRRRFLRTSCLPCFTQDDFETRRQACRCNPWLRKFPAEVLPDGATARRATVTSNSPPIRAAASSTTNCSSNLMHCPNLLPHAVLRMPRRPGMRPT